MTVCDTVILTTAYFAYHTRDQSGQQVIDRPRGAATPITVTQGQQHNIQLHGPFATPSPDSFFMMNCVLILESKS